jgi:hypothetical protein
MTQAAVLASNASLMTTPSGTAPNYMCRAWVNFNGVTTVTIRASGNVTSVTRNGAGDYTVNLTTAMSDANYCAQVSAGVGTSTWSAAAAMNIGGAFVETAPTTSAFRFEIPTYNVGVAGQDCKYVYASVFR